MSLLAVFLLGYHVDTRGIELGGNGHLLRQRSLLAAEPGYLAGGLVILALYAAVLLPEVLVEAVERVDLKHVAAQHGTHRGQFLLETCYLAGIGTLHLAELLEQPLRLELLLSELRDYRIVVYLRLHLAILAGELLILILHFLLVKVCQFLHVLVHLTLMGQPNCKICNATQ